MFISDIIPVGIIAGGTVGSCILLLMFLFAIAFFLYHQRKASECALAACIHKMCQVLIHLLGNFALSALHHLIERVFWNIHNIANTHLVFVYDMDCFIIWIVLKQIIHMLFTQHTYLTAFKVECCFNYGLTFFTFL